VPGKGGVGHAKYPLRDSLILVAAAMIQSPEQAESCPRFLWITLRRSFQNS
jgi:hypothetical protein